MPYPVPVLQPPMPSKWTLLLLAAGVAPIGPAGATRLSSPQGPAKVEAHVLEPSTILAVEDLDANATESQRLLLLRAVPKIRSNKLRTMRGGSQVGGTRVVEKHTLGRKAAECFESFPAPEKGSTVCPSECPFMRFDPDQLCHWKCITMEHCKTAPNMPSSIADPESGLCAVCQVPGCRRCAGSVRSCELCKAGFDLISGWCFPRTRHYWWALYVVLMLVVLVLLWYIVNLSLRQTKNRGVLEQALAHRSRSKARSDDDGHPLYPLTTDLTGVLTTSGGVGVLLHFRFQLAILLWSLAVTVIMGFVAAWHHRLVAADILTVLPTHEEAFETCLAVGRSEASALEAMRIHFLFATGFVYVASTLGALYFSVSQRRTYVNVEGKTVTMADFALWCSGFPADSWGECGRGFKSLEDEYLAFFQASGWGESALGVSIVWNLEDKRDEVNRILNKSLHRLDTEFTRSRDTEAVACQDGQLTAGEAPPCAPADVSGDAAAADASAPAVAATAPAAAAAPAAGVVAPTAAAAPDGAEAAAAGAGGGAPVGVGCWRRVGWRLEVLDDLWWSTSGGDEGSEDTEQDPVANLREMRTAGSVFVVLRTERELHAAKDTPLPKFRGEFEIEAEHLECEPETVLWEGFASSNRQRVWHIFRGCVQIALVILLWGVCCYGPYAYYLMSWQKVAGGSQGGFAEGMILGLVITVGNQLVYAQCASVAETAGYTNRDHRDLLNVILYTTAVLINILIDLWLVTLMAHGWQQDSGVDGEALVRNPSVQHALFVQLVYYIYPCTTLVPFLLEPVFTCVVPYYLSMWLVRSNPAVCRWDAEQALVCMPFDVNRYGDIVINIVLVILLCFLTSVNMWWAFFILVSSAAVIYCWDGFRFLRETQKTYFATDHLDICGQYMLALPCALLAGAFAFKLQGGQAMVKDWGHDSFLGYHIQWVYVVVAMCLHLVVHILLLKLVVPRLVQSGLLPLSVPYSDAASRFACNWFTANPVHCLRSMYYLNLHQPPHVYHIPGKEYLHKRNEAIFAFYESAIYAPEGTFLQESKELVKSQSAAIAGSIKHAKIKMGELLS